MGDSVRRMGLLMVVMAAAMAVAAAAGAAAGAATPHKVAILLPASQTDHGWNQQAVDSMRKVSESTPVQVEVAENLGYGNIKPVLYDLAGRGFDLLICHASGYQTVCPEVAKERRVKVAIIENQKAVTPDLIADIETQAQEVAYLAGVLAASLTTTNTVGVVVSGEPPTWNYMTVGFAEGVHSVRPKARLLYTVIGEAAYEDAAGARRATEAQLARDADVIFGMGDGASFGMMQAVSAAKARGKKAWFIDVIGDKRDIDRDKILLTSVLFDYSGIYRSMLDDIAKGTFGKTYTMDVVNGGVRLLDLPEAVPQAARDAVEQARRAIVDGQVKVSAVPDAAGVHRRLKQLFP